MKDMEKKPCNCKIDGKQYDENDETCIKCKRSQKVLDILFEISIKEALEHGNMSLIEMLIKGAKS